MLVHWSWHPFPCHSSSNCVGGRCQFKDERQMPALLCAPYPCRLGRGLLLPPSWRSAQDSAHPEMQQPGQPGQGVIDGAPLYGSRSYLRVPVSECGDRAICCIVSGSGRSCSIYRGRCLLGTDRNGRRRLQDTGHHQASTQIRAVPHRRRGLICRRSSGCRRYRGLAFARFDCGGSRRV